MLDAALRTNNGRVPRSKMTMRETTTKFETTTITRRTILSGGIACAVASVTPRRLLAGITGWKQGRANLYVFPGAQKGTTVLAATWPTPMKRNLHVKIHAGKQSWNVQVLDNTADAASWKQDDCRIFAGNVNEHAAAVIVEAPNRMLNGRGAIGVWAERFTDAGSRQRTGSPFMAAIVAENYQLARHYHSISPAEDPAALAKDVAEAIAARARKHGFVGDPDAYGRRLASRFLPDVLHYDPELPTGFTFAAQNGRHPGESSALVVGTILNGSPAFTTEEPIPHWQTRFPYLSQV